MNVKEKPGKIWMKIGFVLSVAMTNAIFSRILLGKKGKKDFLRAGVQMPAFCVRRVWILQADSRKTIIRWLIHLIP